MGRMPTRCDEGGLRDFSDRGKHIVYLVPAPGTFKLDWEQVQGYKALGFSLHETEWQDLMNCLTQRTGAGSASRISYVLENPIPDFPFISRLSGLYEDALYEPNEVDRLEAECLKARNLAS